MMFVNTAEVKSRRGGSIGGAMDDFYWIHVDTGNLRAFSTEYRTRADVLQEAGKGIRFAIQTVLDHMPDYDGRMQPAARADAEDFYARAWRLHLGFTEDAGFLQKTAEAFEDVDGRTVRIFEECRGITSAACLIDAQGTPGLSTTTTQQEAVNPDGSTSIITVVKTVNDDGSVTERTTITTQWVLDEKTVHEWNETEKNASLLLLGVLSIPALAVLELPIGVSIAIELIKDVALPQIPWTRYQTGDTVTNIVTIETTTPPVQPYNEPPPAPNITNTTVIIDKDGKETFKDTRGIDSNGVLR